MTVAERSVEDVLAEEITRTEARLEALRFAHNVLTGNPSLALVTLPPPEAQPAETEAPPESVEKVTRKRHTPEERRSIVDRAHELRSCSAAAEEAGVSVASIYLWNKALGRPLPGNVLPTSVSEDLRR